MPLKTIKLDQNQSLKRTHGAFIHVNKVDNNIVTRSFCVAMVIDNENESQKKVSN